MNVGCFSETCTAGKHSKICLTGMAAVNATGIKYGCLSQVNQNPLAVSKELKTLTLQIQKSK